MSQHPRFGQNPADGTPQNDRSQNGRSPADRVKKLPAGEAAAEGSPVPTPANPAPARAKLRTNGLREGEKDISSILRGWDYEPGTLNVRKVTGADGNPKLQLRLDLGLLQMELTGRPDGQQPHGCESLLEYHEQQLVAHEKDHGSDLGFTISSDECQSLRDEAVMYYQRYLSLFVLEEFSGVVRDTARNLRVLDLCNRFAAEDEDRFTLEQYRPYITMMHTRAQASLHFREKRYRDALREIDRGLTDIRDFFELYGQPEAFAKANEVKVLKRFAREVRRQLPVDPLKQFQKKLDRAVKDERYEEAATLRDRIANLKGQPKGGSSARAASQRQNPA